MAKVQFFLFLIVEHLLLFNLLGLMASRSVNVHIIMCNSLFEPPTIWRWQNCYTSAVFVGEAGLAYQFIAVDINNCTSARTHDDTIHIELLTHYSYSLKNTRKSKIYIEKKIMNETMSATAS